MEQVLLILLLLIALAMIGLILLQRSEGGALGIGGGGAGGLMSARSSANLLTRATAILAALFMGLALTLAALNSSDAPTSIADEIAAEQSDDGGPSVPVASEGENTGVSSSGDADSPSQTPSVPVADE